MQVKKGKKSVRNLILIIAKIAAFFIVFAVALALSFRFDAAIVKFATSLQRAWLNPIMILITYAGSSLAVLFISTSLFLLHERKRKWLLPLGASLFFSLAITALIKLLSARVRPFYLGFPTLNVLITSVSGSSFPSSHATAAFSALPVLDREFPRFRFVWLAFACLVAFSRVYFALHYPSDVIFGAFIGYAVGFVLVKIEERYKYSNVFALMGKIMAR
jgi:undecaprenyl-diphosphatase